MGHEGDSLREGYMKVTLSMTFSRSLWVMPLGAVGIICLGGGLGYLLHRPLLVNTFIGVCASGAVVGVVWGLGILRIFLKCPICGSTGELTYGYQRGYVDARHRFECPKCGPLVDRSRLGFGMDVGPEKVSVCPECGYEFKVGEESCPFCPASSKPPSPVRKTRRRR